MGLVLLALGLVTAVRQKESTVLLLVGALLLALGFLSDRIKKLTLGIGDRRFEVEMLKRVAETVAEDVAEAKDQLESLPGVPEEVKNKVSRAADSVNRLALYDARKRFTSSWYAVPKPADRVYRTATEGGENGVTLTLAMSGVSAMELGDVSLVLDGMKARCTVVSPSGREHVRHCEAKLVDDELVWELVWPGDFEAEMEDGRHTARWEREMSFYTFRDLTDPGGPLEASKRLVEVGSTSFSP